MNDYTSEAKERWSKTPEYREFESRKATPALQQIIAKEMMAIFAEFGEIKDTSPDSLIAQTFVEKLQNFISGHFYQCSNETLKSLGEMYIADERFKNNIDECGGEGTAEFVSAAIKVYCKS